MRCNYNIAIVTTGVTSGAGITFPSGAPAFIPGFCVTRVPQLLVICVVSFKSSLNHGINIQLVGSFPFLIDFISFDKTLTGLDN